MDIRKYLQENIVFLDGGMGTLLQARGLHAGEKPERWNITHAEDIIDIQKSYFDAGTNIINTNTFGANCLHFEEDELKDIINAAINNAREAAKRSVNTGVKLVSLDIGPTGKLLKPYGDLDFEEAVGIFAKTVKIGVEAGADLITIETMNDSYETKAALLAAKENSDLPVIVTNAYGEDGKLMTGANPAAMVAMLEGMGADAIGVNCSYGPKTLRPIIDEYLKVASIPVIIKPNAGLPKVIDGKTVYDVLPPEFAEDVADMIRAGVHVAGGCCGTTPEYIKALVDKVAKKKLQPVALSDKGLTVISSYTHAVTFGNTPRLIGERINPTGKKRFKQALIEDDVDYILNVGLEEAEKGAHILDVNVGLPDIDEILMLKKVTYELQAVCDLPLQIDTTDVAAMEAALRIYNGKPLINSVNGKEEVMEAIFPLAKKYGGAIIALTLDEAGIPAKAEGRLEIAKKILKKAAEYGIDKKDIIFDTLVLTLSAEPTAAVETLKALRLIRDELSACTSLGISNISFGLPSRDAINSTFFASALESGLSAAIMNPNSFEMMKTYRAFMALLGQDPNCSDYIAYMEENKQEVVTVSGNAAKTSTNSGSTPLQKAIIKGLKDEAGSCTAELLKTSAPLEIVTNEVIPALDIVGKGYEEKTIFLPQLLMAAESAKSAFEKIKEKMKAEGTKGEAKCKFIIATVHGDVHDIGKNIVRLLLENYGFEVTDLGKDVPPEVIVDEAVKQHAPLVGLSALMTTTVPAMEETIKQLRVKAPWVKVVVGGAVMNQEYADKIGADKYAKDAMETVRYSEEIEKALKE
jgi:5-methyltetrahydrofolate--homocysteine methyltransferase